MHHRGHTHTEVSEVFPWERETPDTSNTHLLFLHRHCSTCSRDYSNCCQPVRAMGVANAILRRLPFYYSNGTARDELRSSATATATARSGAATAIGAKRLGRRQELRSGATATATARSENSKVPVRASSERHLRREENRYSSLRRRNLRRSSYGILREPARVFVLRL